MIKAADCSTCSVGQVNVGNSILNGISLSAEELNCNENRLLYQCDKFEAELIDTEKNKVIKCNIESLNSNKVTNMSLFNCMANGLKISGEELVDLANVPGAIIKATINGFKETKDCNSNLDKKKQLLNNFNNTISDNRFKLEEKFLGKNFVDMPCSEIEKLISQRYDNYRQQIDREIRSHKLTNKNYKIPNELIDNVDLEKVFNEASLVYNCYTPKAKAELTCKVITYLLADAGMGIGLIKAVDALKVFVKTKQISGGASSAIKLSKSTEKKVSNKMPITINKVVEVQHPIIVPPEIQAIQKELIGDYLSFEARDQSGKVFSVPARIIERISDGTKEYAYKISYIEPGTGFVKTVNMPIESIAKLNAKAGDSLIAEQFENAAHKDIHYVDPLNEYKAVESQAEAQAILNKNKKIQTAIIPEGMEVNETTFEQFEAVQRENDSIKKNNPNKLLKKSSDEIEFSLDSNELDLAKKARLEMIKKRKIENAKKLEEDLKNIKP